MSQDGSLTKYAPGSMREVWSISWPIVASLFSGCLMHFCDRLFLGNYSIHALTAAATAWLGVYLFLMTPMITASISTVFVGKTHGAGKHEKLAVYVWQMIWFSICLLPIFYGVAAFAPKFLFGSSDNYEMQTIYFSILLRGGIWTCLVPALSGYFTGQGKTKLIAVTTLMANGINIVLDPLLIFGYGFFPSLGIQGAAIATVSAQLLQTLFLGVLFLRSSRKLGNGGAWRLKLEEISKCLKVGIPAGIAFTSEILAHFVFFKIMERAGTEYLTIVVLMNSIYLLITFLVQGVSRGVTTISANFIGAGSLHLLRRTVKASFKLHLIFFSVLFCTLALGGSSLFEIFVSGADKALFQDPNFTFMLKLTALGVAFYYLLEGFNWTLMGTMMASSDTTFMMIAMLVTQWIVYIIPVYLAIEFFGVSVVYAWGILVVSNLLLFVAYLLRFRQNMRQNFLSSKRALL